MTRFMDKQKQDESKREPPPPQVHVNPDHQQHGAAGFQQNGKKFQQREENDLELREKLCDGDAHHCKRTQSLFYPAPGGLLGRRFVLFSSFGLNIHVLHLTICMASL